MTPHCSIRKVSFAIVQCYGGSMLKVGTGYKILRASAHFAVYTCVYNYMHIMITSTGIIASV